MGSPVGAGDDGRAEPGMTGKSAKNINPIVPFDYLIIDEASQVDISAGALARNNNSI